MAPLAQFSAFRRSTANVKRFTKQLAATPLVGDSPGTPVSWAEQVAARQVVMPVSARAYILRETFVIGEYPSLADEIDAFLVGGGAARAENGAPPGELLPTISEPEQEAKANEVAISTEPLLTPPATPRLDDPLPDRPTLSLDEYRTRCKAESLPASGDQEYAVYHKPNAFASRANLTLAPSGAFIVGDCSLDSLQDSGRRQALVVPPMLPSPPPSPITSSSSAEDLRNSAGGSRDAGAPPAVESVDTSRESDKEVSSPGAVQIQAEESSGRDGPMFASSCSTGVTAKAARTKFSQQLVKTWHSVRPAVKKRLAELEMVVRDIDRRSDLVTSRCNS